MRKENEEASRDGMRIPTTELSDIDDVVQRCGICDVTFGCFAVVSVFIATALWIG